MYVTGFSQNDVRANDEKVTLTSRWFVRRIPDW